MTTTSVESEPRAQRERDSVGFRPRSFRAATGALVLLLALPLTLAVELLVPGHSEVLIHVLLGIGTLLVGLSVFDFAAPASLSRIACGAACVLAAIFFLQAQGALPDNEAIRSFAYSTQIGGWAEAIAVSIVMAWIVAVARTYGRGLTMVVGAVSGLIVIALSAWGLLAAPAGGTPAELRLFFLLPVGWLLFVSTRPRSAA